MYTGTLISDLQREVARAFGDKAAELPAGMPTPPDFVSYGECRAAAEKHLQEHHPDLERNLINGAEVKRFCILVASAVAWNCAAEASRRAKASFTVPLGRKPVEKVGE